MSENRIKDLEEEVSDLHKEILSIKEEMEKSRFINDKMFNQITKVMLELKGLMNK